MFPASRGRSPVTRLKSVVLPAPFGPMIRRRSPGAISSETSSIAGRPPNAFFRLWMRSAAAFQVDPLRAGNHAFGHEHHDEHEDEAEQHVPALDVGGDVVL